MDNYRHPMYTHYSRNMGAYQNTPCNCRVTPIIDVGAEKKCDHCDYKDYSDHKDHCDDKDYSDKKDHHCDKDYNDMRLDDMPLAMAYVPFQKWRKVTDGACGMAVGTIFQELVLPFYGSKNACRQRGDRS